MFAECCFQHGGSVGYEERIYRSLRENAGQFQIEASAGNDFAVQMKHDVGMFVQHSVSENNEKKIGKRETQCFRVQRITLNQ